MKNKKVLMQMAAGAMAFIMSLSVSSITVAAEETTGKWKEENGNFYWYENGIKQGTEGRGKEIYDPGTNAWYWLDAIDGGKKAVGKDVYQESKADDAGTIGKWVRYDENGHMIKGWDEKDGNKYYFDMTYGTMAKGKVIIEGETYYFNEQTGIMEKKSSEQQSDNGENDILEAEWIDNLYNSLLQDDYETVMLLLESASNVEEKCADYEYTEWEKWDDETAYKLTADDGTIFGIVIYKTGEYWDISAFISSRKGSNYGFSDIGKGDHFVEMTYNINGTSYNYIKNGNTVIYSDGSTYALDDTTIYIVWHM